MFPEVTGTMPSGTKSRRIELVIVGYLLMCVTMIGPLVPAARAAQPVIDRVKVDAAAAEIAIQIMFNRLLRYIDHSPKTSGRFLVINLRPVRTAAEDAEAFSAREIANLTGDRSDLIEEIRYEGDHPTGPKLEITFTRRVEFLVAGASDLRSVYVFVPQQASPVKPKPRSDLPSDAEETLPPASADNPQSSGNYVLNLRSGQQSFTAQAVPDSEALKRHRLYSYPFQKNGETWYRLRLGFFTTKEQARAVISSLPDQYFDAWIATVDAEERNRSADHLVFGGARAPAKGPENRVPLARSEVPSRRPAEIIEQASPVLSGDYVLNLASGTKPFTAQALPESEIFTRHRLYSYPFQKNGQTWYRLRLGFFASKTQAREVIRSLPKRYADAWIAKVSAEERESSANHAVLESRTPPTEPPENPEPVSQPAIAVVRPENSGSKGLPAISDEKLAKIWEEAKAAMTRKDFPRAIQLYTKLLQLPNHQYYKQSREYLGLARERNGQFAHAKAEYELYLQQYPKDEGADRVRQRLAGILTSKSEPKSKLRVAKRSTEKSEWETQNYGSISQFYTYRESVTDAEGRLLTQSDLVNDLDFTTRVTNDRFDLRALFVGSHVFNFADQGDANESRISSVYLDALDREIGLSTRIGRQTRNSGGVLGRFDGAYLGYQIMPTIKLNGVAGLPVVSTASSELDKDRYFYGLSMDLGPYDKAWNFNLFAINQEVDGINERRAVGGEARYLRDGISAFSLVDYDINFNDLNIALFNGTATLKNKTTINFSADYRKSPVLLASNGVQGQGTDLVAVLLNSLSADEIRELAEDRSADTHSVTLGASHPLSDKYQVSGDVTATRLSGTDASGGVEATEGTNYELFYSTQFTGTNLFKEGDVEILGLRFSDTKSSKTATVDLNVRYPIDQQWRLNPRIRSDYRFAEGEQGSRIRIRPSMRVNYRWRRPVNIEFEVGGEWSTEQITDDAALGTGDTQDAAEWYARLGYRLDF